MKNYIPVYFDGEKIVLGPFIIPQKTLCLECITSDELKLLNRNINRANQVKLENI